LNLGRGVGDDPGHVAENHTLLARDIGYEAERLYEVTQVHGARVAEVDLALAPAAFRVREADALFCSRMGPRASTFARPRGGVLLARGPARFDQQDDGVAVGVRVADCAAILIAHPESGGVAAVHAGWRGVVQGVLANTLSAFTASLEARPGALIAALFPHIGGDAFEVGTDVAHQIAASAPEDPRVINWAGEKPHADLGRAIRAQLLRAGLLAEHIEHIPGCTFREPARFFSYRRDGSASGRHLAVIVAGC
jgi:YfiH family protein